MPTLAMLQHHDHQRTHRKRLVGPDLADVAAAVWPAGDPGLATGTQTFWRPQSRRHLTWQVHPPMPPISGRAKPEQLRHFEAMECPECSYPAVYAKAQGARAKFMPFVLIVEDDPTTRVVHAKALSDMVGYTVVTASSVAEGKAMLHGTVPDLLLLDLRLPDGTGLDLLQALRQEGRRSAIMVVSAFPEDLPAGTHGATRLSVLTKPIAPEELRCRVLEALQVKRPDSEFTLPEFLQMACLGGHSIVLVVTTDQRAGFVAIHKGEIWAACFGEQNGFEAFFQMTCLDRCGIELRPFPQQGLSRELTGGYQELLMEAARQQDERGLAPGRPAPDEDFDTSVLLDGIDEPSANAPHQSAAVADLVAAGVQAVISRDYAEAVRWLEQALALDTGNAGIRHRLERLYQLGYGPDRTGMETSATADRRR